MSARESKRSNRLPACRLCPRRYPGDPAVASDDTPDPENTPLSRVIRTVAAFWKVCGRKDCTPVDGMSIMAYDGFDTGPPTRHKRLLQQLLLRQQQSGWRRR